MSDFEDESTSESEIESDSSDSSEYPPEQQYHAAPKQVAKNVIPKKAAALAHETATTSGEEHVASPTKVSKFKKISAKGQKAGPKLVAKKCNTPKGINIT